MEAVSATAATTTIPAIDLTESYLIGLQERYVGPQDQLYIETLSRQMPPKQGDFVKTESLHFNEPDLEIFQRKLLPKWPGQFGLKNIRIVSTNISGIDAIKFCPCDRHPLDMLWLGPIAPSFLNPASVFPFAANTLLPFIERKQHSLLVKSSVPVSITYDVYHIEAPLPPRPFPSQRWNVHVHNTLDPFHVPAGQTRIKHELCAQNLVIAISVFLTIDTVQQMNLYIDYPTNPPFRMQRLSPNLWMLGFGQRGLNLSRASQQWIEYETNGEPHKIECMAFQNTTIIWKERSLVGITGGLGDSIFFPEEL